MDRNRFVTIGTDKSNLRLKINRQISLKIFGVEKKYLYLGMIDNATNRTKAERIALLIQRDIELEKLDLNLKNYLPIKDLTDKVGIAFDPNAANINLLDLYKEYMKIYKDKLAESTLEVYNKRYEQIIILSPQDLNNQNSLIKSFSQNSYGDTFNCICGLIFRLIEWGKKNDLLPETFKNNIKTIQADYKQNRKKALTKRVREIPGYYHDFDYKGYSKKEINTIVNAFYESANDKFYFCPFFKKLMPYKNSTIINRKRIAELIELRFLTGCRAGEAVALNLSNIGKNFEYIIFEKSYDSSGKKIKCLKRERVCQEGTLARKFPTGDKLKLLLEKIYDRCISTNQNFLFQSTHGSIFANSSVHRFWLGHTRIKKGVHKFYPGVVFNLVEREEISQYLKPYSTRHSWINLQIKANVPIANIAKLAGNSPQTIMNNYASYISEVNHVEF